MAKEPCYLLSKLPSELLHNILRLADPVHLAHLSETCKALYEFISDNQRLYKDIYIRVLDEPPTTELPVDWNWETQVINYARFEVIIEHPKYEAVEKKEPHLPFVAHFVTTLLRTSSPNPPSRNIRVLKNSFLHRNNKIAFMCQSEIFARAKKLDSEAEEDEGQIVELRCAKCRQASAKIHSLFGVPLHHAPNIDTLWPYAVAKVYDLRNYTPDTLWGPYLPDGKASVDWEKIEAILIVLGHNLDKFSRTTRGLWEPMWKIPWAGAAPNSFKPISLLRRPDGPTPAVNPNDPYNVTGTWVRVVCFLDYNELFNYNFNTFPEEEGTPREPLYTSQSLRLIVMELHVTNIEDPGPEDGQQLPVVYFSGTARSLHESFDPNTTSQMVGSVRMTEEGEVRWTGTSVYNGEERWRSEGIQIGGLCSGKGVVGHWFEKDWVETGPAGPTAYWKVSNETDRREETLSDVGMDAVSDTYNPEDSEGESEAHDSEFWEE